MKTEQKQNVSKHLLLRLEVILGITMHPSLGPAMYHHKVVNPAVNHPDMWPLCVTNIIDRSQGCGVLLVLLDCWGGLANKH